jgi:hypothetical protein
MTALTAFSPDPAADQREVDLMSLQVARMGLAEARAKGLPFSTHMLTDQRIRDDLLSMQSRTGCPDAAVIDAVAEGYLSDDDDEAREAMRARVRQVMVAMVIGVGAF